MLRVACCVLRVACCVLRVACCVLCMGEAITKVAKKQLCECFKNISYKLHGSKIPPTPKAPITRRVALWYDIQLARRPSCIERDNAEQKEKITRRIQGSVVFDSGRWVGRWFGG